MQSIAQLGIQSYCFREFKDNAVVANQVRELGLGQIEVCAVHADFNDPSTAQGVERAYQDCGIDLVSIGVQTFTGADAEENWFRWAEAAGAAHISAHFQVDTFQRAIVRVREWSRRYGIRVGIHNHGGYLFGGQPDAMRMLLGLGAPEIGLCLDTAWCLQIGPRHGKPLQWVEEFGPALTALHLKDFRFDPDGQWQDTLVGEGNLDLSALFEALRAQAFSGLYILEYEADAADPVPALRRCVERVRAVLEQG